MKTRTAIFELEDRFIGKFQVLRGAMDILITDQSLSSDNVNNYSDCRVISTFIGSSLNVDTLDKLPNLALIITRSTGVDHIDLEYCYRRKIAVCNVPNYGPNSVAEYAFGLLLSLARKLEPAIYETRHGRFGHAHLRGAELFGKTLGIIGTGNIGSSMARIGHGFGMQIIGHDPQQNAALCNNYDLRYVGLDSLLQTSDIISLHIPASSETRHLLGAVQFNQVKKGAILINTSRGEVIDVFSLIKALQSGRLGAAGLDVLADEGYLRDPTQKVPASASDIYHANHTLMNLPNVIVTPHNAFNTHAAVERIIDISIDVMQGYLDGQLINGVSTA